MVKLKRLGVVLRPKDGPNGKFAKFNAGMVAENDTVHMLYRWGEKEEPRTDYSKIYHDAPYAQSFVSYARLSLDGKLVYDSDKPVIYPTTPLETRGCEDARVVPFEGSYYIFYCAYDGRKARMGVASTRDFEHYCKLGIIEVFAWDKDHYIFPERINGKIAFVHRVEPNIQIDYFDSFADLLNPKSWDNYEEKVESSTVLRAAFEWEGFKIGGSVPPIKTDQGWLFLYHGVDSKRIYHVSAALLDLENPFVVKARLPYPILSPEEDYEVNGHYQGCVFPQGAYVHNGELYVSYGAADVNVAIAKVNLDELIDELNRHPVRS